MKHFRPTTRQTQQIFTALVLTSILSLGGSTTFVKSVAADVSNPQGVTNLKQTRTNQLPTSIADAVLRAASRELGIPRTELQITIAQQRNWPDSCLGLASPGQICTQATVPGWRVIVEGRQQRLIYRTNRDGSQVRLNERANSSSGTSLPSPVAEAILQTASQRIGLQPSELRIVKSEQITTDGCLSLPRPGEACNEIGLRVWEVTVEGGQQRLVYRSTSNASLVRFNASASSGGNASLPQSVTNVVLQTAAERTGLRPSELRIVQSQQIQGSSSCLGLPAPPGEGCTRDLAALWQVTVEGGKQRLVYHTNMNGSRIGLNEAASNLSGANLPSAVANAVLQFAAQDLGVSSSQLRITNTQQQTWRDSCLGLPRPTERCMGTPTPGWRVSVENKREVQVYRTDTSGSRIRAEDIAEQPTSDRNLPDSIAKAVLREATNQSILSMSQLRIVQAEQQDWPNGCLGIVEPGRFCTQAIVPGWRVTVAGERQTFVYRTNESGSVIKQERGATQGNSGAIPIPKSELPPPLGEGVLFRAISSGGFAGQTYETTLLNNGRIIRTLITSSVNASTPDMTYISPEQLRQFKQLLAQSSMAQYDGLSYPAPRGAADYITVTLSSRDSTTRYVDIAQERLPEALQDVIRAWNQIASGQKPLW